jgi:hypothetical protein
VVSATNALPRAVPSIVFILGLVVVAVAVCASALRACLGAATASCPRACSNGASVVATSGAGRVTSSGIRTG